MNNVKLSPADRKTFAERLGRPIPDPDSEAFDDLLEELRRMKPDVYAELVTKLDYVGETLPVEKEAKLASRRSAIQHAIDHVRNRQTHDGKTVSDKRKLIIGGLAGVGVLFVWMTFSSFQAPYTPGETRAQAPSETEAPTVQKQEAPSENGFGVRAPRGQFAANLNFPPLQSVATTRRAAASSDLPPQTDTDAPTPIEAQEAAPAEPDSADTQASSTDLPPRDPSDLPPQPTPVTSGAATVPPNPYAPPTTTGQTVSGGVSTTPETLPTSLSFEPTQQVGELPTTLSSEATANPTVQTGLDGVPLSTADEASSQPERESSLSWERASSAATAPDVAVSLSWAEPDTQPQAASTLAVPQASISLPAVPQVGNAAAAPAPTERAQPQPTNLADALTTGSELEAELVTAVAATGDQSIPVLAKTTGRWCQKRQCPEITWIGEATYDGADRVDIIFAEAVVEGTQQAVTATAFDTDRLPGIIANVGDGAPTAVQDLLRGAVGGASDYLSAINTRTTTTVQDGVVVQEEAEPDLGNVLLGRSASLFALPADQTSVVRYASLAEGKRITLIYGIEL